MKRKVLYALMISMMIGLVGCGKTTDETSKQKETEVQFESIVAREDDNSQNEVSDTQAIAGVYKSSYEEELEGEKYQFDCFLVLNDDGKGYMVIQDVIPVTWDAEKIVTDSFTYTIVANENEVVLNEGDFETVYTRMDGEYPEFIEDLLTGSNTKDYGFDYSPYSEIVDKYATAVKEKWDMEKLEENNLNYVVAFYMSEEGTCPVGYYLNDLDGDGIKELMIGFVSKDEFTDKMVLEAYDIKDGELTQIFKGWERNRYYLMYDDGDAKEFANEGSGGAGNSGYHYYVYNGNEMVVVQAVIYDYDSSPENPWFETYDNDWDISNDTPITEVRFNEIVDAHSERYMALDFVPVTEGFNVK